MSKKQKILTIIFVYIMTILNGFLLFGNQLFYLNSSTILKYEFFTLLTFILSYLLYKNKDKNIEKTFIIIYIILGTLYLFAFPIGTLVDEPNHFYRSYEISNGNLISQKKKNKTGYLGVTKVSKNVRKVVEVERTKIKTENLIKEDKKQKKEYVDFTNISFYSFICYLPQALGVLIGRTLDLPILFWCYLARIFNFITFTLLLRFSLKNIPFKKTTLMFIVMLPMAMQTAISMSADCLSLGVSLALVSYVLKLVNKPNEKMKKKDYIILGVLSIILSQCKLVYLPLCLITLLIPKSKFNSKRRKYLNIGMIILLSVILNLCWLSIATQYISSISEYSDLQLKYILKNPISYLGILITTYVTNFDYYTRMLMGSTIGNLNIYTYNIYIDIDILITFLLFSLDRKNVKIDKKNKCICGLIFLIVILLISTSLYLEWTTYRNLSVLGIQGRYFLPIFILSFLIFDNDLIRIKDNKIFNRFYLLLFMIIQNISIISYIFICYRFF